MFVKLRQLNRGQNGHLSFQIWVVWIDKKENFETSHQQKFSVQQFDAAILDHLKCLVINNHHDETIKSRFFYFKWLESLLVPTTETWIFPKNLVKTMSHSFWCLAPCIARGPFYKHGLTSAWIRTHMLVKSGTKLLIHSWTSTAPLKFGNGISNFIPHFMMDVITCTTIIHAGIKVYHDRDQDPRWYCHVMHFRKIYSPLMASYNYCSWKYKPSIIIFSITTFF